MVFKKPSGTLSRNLYRESAFLHRESAGRVGKYHFHDFMPLLCFWPLGPVTNFPGDSNDTNLTRRIDRCHFYHMNIWPANGGVLF